MKKLAERQAERAERVDVAEKERQANEKAAKAQRDNAQKSAAEEIAKGAAGNGGGTGSPFGGSKT